MPRPEMLIKIISTRYFLVLILSGRGSVVGSGETVLFQLWGTPMWVKMSDRILYVSINHFFCVLLRILLRRCRIGHISQVLSWRGLANYRVSTSTTKMGWTKILKHFLIYGEPGHLHLFLYLPGVTYDSNKFQCFMHGSS
jgi:hypothetical protein